MRSKKTCFENLVFNFLVLCGFLILISEWISLFWRNTILILGISILGTYIVSKKYLLKIDINPTVGIIGLLVFFMACYPLLFNHPFYPASADGITTIATRIMGEIIPSTYSPYSNMSFVYQKGFPFLSKIFVDLFPFAQDYLILWLLGAVFGFLQVVLIYNLGKKITMSENGGIWASIFFVGIKQLFQLMYFGLYSEIVATTFFIFALLLLIEKNTLAYLFIPIVFITNPSIALTMLVLFFIYFLIFGEIKQFIFIIISLFLATPSLIGLYLPALTNTVKMDSRTSFDLLKALIAFPLWIGLVPFLGGTIGLFIIFFKKMFDRTNIFLIISAFSGFVLYLTLGFMGSGVYGKIPTLTSIFFVLISCLAISKFEINKKYFVALMILILISCMVVFFTSGYLTKLRSGTKITPNEAEFSEIFKNFDPKLESALILSPSSGKIAEFSNKIPYDIINGNLVSLNTEYLLGDPGFEEVISKEANKNKIIKDKCLSCIDKLNVKYIVVNNDFFDEELKYPIVLTHKNFKIYKKD